MPIDVSWGEETQTYIYIRVEGVWTWSEYHASLQQANELIHSVNYDVALITHLVDNAARILPPNAFSHWRRSIRNNPPNLKTVIIVPGYPRISLFVNSADRIFRNILSFRFRMADTLDEARNIVSESYPLSTPQH